MKLTQIVLIALLITLPLNGQDITNKLGGNDANATYDITNSDNDLLFRVDGNHRTAMGLGTIADRSTQTVVGTFNEASDDNEVFVVGCGFNNSTRDNAFEVNFFGDITAKNNVIAKGDVYCDDIWTSDDVRADDDDVAKEGVFGKELYTKFGGTSIYYILDPSAGFVKYAQVSDKSLKNDVNTISSPLEKLQLLRGVTYKWNQTAKDYFVKDIKENVIPDESFSEDEKEVVWEEERQKLLSDADRNNMSFIAQEVEEVFPEWVKENEDGYKELSMKGLDGLLVEALKELKEEKDNEIQELREEIAGLKSIITEILMIKD